MTIYGRPHLFQPGSKMLIASKMSICALKVDLLEVLDLSATLNVCEVVCVCVWKCVVVCVCTSILKENY